MFPRRQRLVFLKLLSLFSVVRGYNIPIVMLAQYLSAIFILAPAHTRALSVILDPSMFLLVLASSLAIASGYIINNFYDLKKDYINRPYKFNLDRWVSQKTKFYIYFSINGVVLLLAWIVSYRAALFFSGYMFLLWFYSHKLKKYPIVGNLIAVFLAILPFFALLLYYKNLEWKIIGHAVFLYLLLLIREMIKDLENLQGDLAANYQTLPVRFGEIWSKRLITVITLLTLLPIYFLVEYCDVGLMELYLYGSIMVLLLVLWGLWEAKSRRNYNMMHNMLKFLLLAGVCCIPLINPKVLVHGKKVIENYEKKALSSVQMGHSI
ncbi:MAG: ubiquinone biosynthesis protein UbiA [Flavobacterium sp. BFFFF2]|nr:MAG: ubiquinone biosynthesis protein UbiA [Flavobacterium sp. BFFFF2]